MAFFQQRGPNEKQSDATATREEARAGRRDVPLPARQELTKKRLGRAALVAAVVHVELLLVFAVIAHRFSPRTAELGPQDPVEVTTMSEAEARELLGDLDQPAPEADEPKKEDVVRRAPETPAGQVVEIPTPANETPAKNARFVAERDSTVDRETRRLGQLDERATTGGSAASGGAPPSPPAQAAPAPPRPTLLSMRGATRGLVATPSETAPAAEGPPPVEEHAEGLLAPRSAHLSPSQMRRPSRGAAPSFAALMPTREQVASAVGSGTMDHLADVDDGDATALNTRAWRFASFFNRVKRQVRDNWKAADEFQKRDPTGSIYGAGQRSTLLRISLKVDGSLAGVTILRPSGIEFLDDIAVEAVKRAQPFANPPQQLVDDSGGINFRFGFFFDVAGAPKMRVFRYSSM